LKDLLLMIEWNQPNHLHYHYYTIDSLTTLLLSTMQTRSKTRARAILFMSNLKNRQMMHSPTKLPSSVSLENHSIPTLNIGSGITQNVSDFLNKVHSTAKSAEKKRVPTNQTRVLRQPTAEKVSEGDSRENAQSVNTSEPSTTPDEYQQTRYNTRSRSRAFTTPISAKPAATPSAPVKSCDSSIHAEESDNQGFTESISPKGDRRSQSAIFKRVSEGDYLENDSESSEYCDDDDDDDEDYQPVNLSKQFRKEILDVRIDFAEASRAWRANKVSIGEGQFAYK
jgi:hypothetical protein